MARKSNTETARFYEGIGRRKRSTARVRLMEGEGEVLVNGKPIADVFPSALARDTYSAPLRVIGQLHSFYGSIHVSGGGVSGQIGAIRHGIARALVAYKEDFRPLLRKAGFLTRDPREVERKKYNLHKARRAHQFSKR